jgi:hypothetical protein
VLVAVTAVITTGVLAGCTRDRSEDRQQGNASTPARAPALGGPTPRPHRPPSRAMDPLERSVAERLAGRIAADDLRLGYLDCPHWDGTVPSALTCKGYVEGLVALVRVRVRGAAGRGVSFDAQLGSGMVATRRVERMLRDNGWEVADCGHVPAYPARVGMRIVCRVQRDARDEFVVATVRSHAGRVTVADYARSAAAR